MNVIMDSVIVIGLNENIERGRVEDRESDQQN